jgi:hypothetical protein
MYCIFSYVFSLTSLGTCGVERGSLFGVWDHGITWRHLLFSIMYHIDDDNDNDRVYASSQCARYGWIERVKYQRPDMSLLTKVAYDTHCVLQTKGLVVVHENSYSLHQLCSDFPWQGPSHVTMISNAKSLYSSRTTLLKPCLAT